MLDLQKRWPCRIGITLILAGGLLLQNRATAVSTNQPAAAPLPSPLSEDEAVHIGLETNPLVIAEEAGVASAKASYRSLAAFPNPQLGLSRVQGTSTAPSLTGNTDDTIVSVNETLDTSGQRRFQAAGNKAAWFATQQQFNETRLSLAQQIHDAYWGLVAARAQTQIALENLRDAQRVYDLTRLQEKAGSSPRVDVLNSSIDMENSEQTYVSAQGAEKAALSALNLLLSRPPYAPVTPADSLSTTATTVSVTLPDLQELTRLAQENRPLLKAAREQVMVAEYALKQAIASRFPDLTVSYQRSLEEPVDSEGISVGFPLFDFGSIKNSVRAADQARKQAKTQQTQVEQQISQQVAQAYTDYTQAERLLTSYQADILKPSEKLLDMAQLGYKQGATGILNVITAETTLRAARTGYINSLLALHKAADELLASTGGIPGVITMPTENRKPRGKG